MTPVPAARTALETVGTRAFALLLGAIASLIIARALGPSGRGEYVYPAFVVGLLAVAGHLSYDFVNIHLSSTSAANERILALTAFAISGFAGLATVGVLAILWVAVPAIFADIRVGLVIAAATALPFLVQQYALTSVLVVSSRMRAVNIATAASAAVQVTTVVVLAATGTLTPFSVLVVATVATVTCWAMLLSALRPPLGLPPRHLVRRALRYSARIHVGAVITILMWRGDVFFVKGYLGVREVGLYTLAVFLAEFLLVLVEATSVAATPRQINSDAPESLSASVHRLAMSALVLGSLALMMSSPVLVLVVYGSDFADALVPLLLLLPGLVLFGSSRPIAIYLLRLENPWRMTTAATAALAVNVVGNLLVIQRFGLNGVAVVASLTYGVLYLLIAQWFLQVTGIGWRSLVPRAADIRLLSSLLLGALRRR